MTSPTDRAWSSWADDTAAAIRDAGQWRTPRAFDANGPAGTARR